MYGWNKWNSNHFHVLLSSSALGSSAAPQDGLQSPRKIIQWEQVDFEIIMRFHYLAVRPLKLNCQLGYGSDYHLWSLGVLGHWPLTSILTWVWPQKVTLVPSNRSVHLALIWEGILTNLSQNKNLWTHGHVFSLYDHVVFVHHVQVPLWMINSDPSAEDRIAWNKS